MPIISFDGNNVALEDIQDNPAQYATRLGRAKVVPGFAVCGCMQPVPDRPLRLVVRRHGTVFHLARWPDEGPLHNRDTCPFFSEKTSPGHGAPDPDDAIRVTSDRLDVKLDVSFTIRTAGPVSRRAATAGTGSQSRRAAPLLAFLQRLWLDARLNHWAGGTHRNWGTCNAQLLAQLGDGKINGKPMQDVLHVMRLYEKEAAATIKAEFDAFLSRITRTDAAVERGIVIAELKSVEKSKYGFVIKIRQTYETFYVSSEIIDSVNKSYRHAWPQIGKSDARVVVVLVLERTKDDNLRIVDLALQLCNRAFIPCDSGYEVEMANRLALERRRFEKPMRFFEADELLPDFILTDTALPTYVEVWGMESNAQYRARKAEKQAIYARKQTPVVEWTPPADLNMVPIPLAT
jgi:hypothetical protein